MRRPVSFFNITTRGGAQAQRAERAELAARTAQREELQETGVHGAARGSTGRRRVSSVSVHAAAPKLKGREGRREELQL